MKIFAGKRKTRLYGRGVNNKLPKGLNWERIEKIPRQEGRNVVKGTSKRVVLVKSPDVRYFEQAIFILKEDLMEKEGSSDVLREAQRVADEYVKSYISEPKHLLSNMPPAFYAGVGAIGGALCSFAIFFFM